MLVVCCWRQLQLAEPPGRGSQALVVVRIENTYEQGGVASWVDARVAWSNGLCTLTLANGVEQCVDYNVQAYLVHRHGAGVAVARGMQSGHYVAYFKLGGVWYLADDSRVTRLTEAPIEFPYIVLLARCDRARGAHMAAMRKRAQGI